ncbi:succinate dehydrogenase, cytochrome b556 subunit [Sphingomonas nostoxanthinifaciens]|uniref:succinate dehydrogenase, cytochrome b556 subunit n=1 Tax=Sphingomonas nostoxanthinifaciens TaxID=2872652 RepID=UPI001CC1C88D|nr:succinate dehydrogenase, cytochrome b556 subunit [Sphingomonas nostoxanthinifaciens]UAK25970.1 succinate dehydrogenase, cytochrome b556 subunit [Sphingomonas nostoxanthinifaciens]
MARNSARPLSPHLSIWKWGPHMAVSIVHRATGSALAVGGGVLFVWWLIALAGGEASYGGFVDLMTSDRTGTLNLIPAVILIGLTWSFLQHLCSGVRHLLLDTGAGYELKINRVGALATFAISILLTLVIWAAILGRGAY